MVFSWSIHFIIEKVVEMFSEIFKKTLGNQEIENILQNKTEPSFSEEKLEKSDEEIKKSLQESMII